MSADALIDDVQRKRRVERHRTVLVKFCEHRRAEKSSWHLNAGAMRRDLYKIANYPARLPWKAYHQFVLERARDFNLFRFKMTTTTAEVLGPASDELPEWWTLEPDSDKLDAFRDILRAEGVEAIYAGWRTERDSKVDAQTERDEEADKQANTDRAENIARLLESYRRAVIKSTGPDDLFALDSQSMYVKAAVSGSTASRQLQYCVPREFSQRLRATEESRFHKWVAANPGVQKEFSDLDQATLHAARLSQSSDVPTWRPKKEKSTNRERGPYRKNLFGDPGYSPDAEYVKDDVAALNYRGVPGMYHEPLMSSEDEVALCTWQLVNGIGSALEIAKLIHKDKTLTPLSFTDVTGSASREDLFAEAQAIGFYVGAEKPGTKGLFQGIEDEWAEVRAEKASGYHEPWRWWRGAALDLLTRHRAGSPREAVIKKVVQARERLRGRTTRAHPLEGIPLFWPLDDVFERGLTLTQVAELRWPDDRKDNALVKAARSFRAALRDLRAANTTSCNTTKNRQRRIR